MKPAFLRSFIFAVLITSLISLSVFQTGLAAPGDLDPSFNFGTGGTNGVVYAVARQTDGKILIGGSFTAYNGVTSVPANLLRLNVDGSLDTTFNALGAGANGWVDAIVLQPDGKILVGGYFSAYNNDAGVPDHLLRLNPDGSVDITFNPAGLGPNDEVLTIALQSNGQILLGGYFTSYNGNSQAPDRILRLDANGTLDPNFNVGSGSRGANSTVMAILVQPDGQIVVGGAFLAYNGSAAGVVMTILRLNATDGQRDLTFNPSGGGTGSGMNVRTLALQPDGKLLVGGYFSKYLGDSSTPDNLMRINPNGSLDGSFNYGGSGAFASGGHAVDTIALQPDGKILIGGYFTDYNDDANAPDHLLRVNADGSLDQPIFNYGNQGLDGEVFSLALQPDGRILASGNFTTYNGDGNAPDNILRLVVSDAPRVLSSQRTDPNPTNAASVGFTVTFSKAVTGVDTSLPFADFVLTTTGITGAAVTNVTGSGDTYVVTVSTGSGSGTLRLDLPADATITDLDSSPLANLPFTGGEAYTIDKIAPTVDTFAATTPTNSLSIPISTFTASDDVVVTGYKITTSPTPPVAGDAGWTSTAPATYPVARAGTYTLYPWAKDAVGNVSAVFGSPRMVVVTANVEVLIAGISRGTYDLPSGGSTRESYALVNDGPVKVTSAGGAPILAAQRILYTGYGTQPTSFVQMMGLPDSQLDTTYWFPWYKNVGDGVDTQLRIGNVSGSTAMFHIYVAGVEVTGSPFTLTTSGAGQSQRLSFALNDGPVKVVSDQKIVATERLIYFDSGAPTSFSEMLGLPNSQLSKTYWFPWYKNVGEIDTQLRIGNVSGATASVHVYIGGVEMTGSPFTLTASGAGQSLRVSFPVNDGPVKVVSDQNIVAAQRILYYAGGVPTSFAETMGIPESQLSKTYWSPWYKNDGIVDTQLRIANVSGLPASVHIYIGTTEMAGSPFALTASGAGQSLRLSFTVNDGPVKLVSDQNIIASERLIYFSAGVAVSFSEMMGLPDNLLNMSSWLPWYKNVGEIDTQLRFAVP